MIAVVVVLFQLLDATDSSKLDASLSKAQTAATNLFETKREDAMVAARAVQDDVGLATAINDEDDAQVRQRLDQLARRIDAKRIVLVVDGFGTLRDRHADRDRRRLRASCRTRTGATIGEITVSTTTAEGLRARGAAAARGPGPGRPRRRACWRRRSRRSRTSELPSRSPADVAVGNVDYRMSRFTAEEPDGEVTVVSLFALDDRRAARARWWR